MRLRENLIAYQTFIRKELMRTFRIWPQTLLPPVMTMTLYFLIFGRIIDSKLQVENGFTYMQYIAPGLIMMSIITNSYIHTSSAFFSMKFQRSIEEILISPMSNVCIILAFITSAIFRASIVAILVTVIALSFTHLALMHAGLLVLTVIVTSFFFATVGLLNGIFARTFDDVSWIPSFVITPLTYLGGVFFSVNMLSGVWQTLAYLNPILYVIDIFRYSMLGIVSTNITVALLILLAFTIVAFFYTLHLIQKSSRVRN